MGRQTKKKVYALVLVMLSALAGGCAHCTGDPYTDPTHCMFDETALKKWTTEKRIALSELNQKLLVLDGEVDSSIDELLRVERSLSTAEIPERELEEINSQISKLKKEAEQLSDQVIRHEIESKKIAETIENAPAINEELNVRIAEEKQKVSDMEKNIETLVEDLQHLNRQALSRS